MVEERNILRIVYTFFLGLLLALFVGIGINTFYPGPEEPQYPTELRSVSKELTDEQRAAELQYEQDMRNYYENEMQPYNRDVSMIALGAAVLLLVVSLLAENKIRILSDGVMLGAVLTMIYSIGRSLASQDTKYEFIVVSVGLAVVLYLGYHRFVRRHSREDAKAKLV